MTVTAERPLAEAPGFEESRSGWSSLGWPPISPWTQIVKAMDSTRKAW